jgi:hypothetical protein
VVGDLEKGELIEVIDSHQLDSGKFSSRVSEKRKSDMRYKRVPLCPKLADIEKSIASAIYQLCNYVSD